MRWRFETERLVLRPWNESDAEALFRYAKDPAVGPIAGWPPHTSVEHSRQIIRDVFSAPETFAVVLKELGEPVGCAGLLFGEDGTLPLPPGEAELGYWIGKPFWGRGLIPEAARAVIRHAFVDLGVSSLWCICDATNAQSKRVMEKCGFAFHHTEENVPCPLMGDVRSQYCTIFTGERWRTGTTIESGHGERGCRFIGQKAPGTTRTPTDPTSSTRSSNSSSLAVSPIRLHSSDRSGDAPQSLCSCPIGTPWAPSSRSCSSHYCEK